MSQEKSCLLSKCLLVLDKVNEVSARDRKPFLQEGGVWKRVRGTDGVASSNEQGNQFQGPQSMLLWLCPAAGAAERADVQLVRLLLSAPNSDSYVRSGRGSQRLSSPPLRFIVASWSSQPWEEWVSTSRPYGQAPRGDFRPDGPPRPRPQVYLSNMCIFKSGPWWSRGDCSNEDRIRLFSVSSNSFYFRGYGVTVENS